MIAIPPLKGTDGKQIAVQQALIGNVAVLSKDTKNAELLIKLFNYVFSPEGQKTTTTYQDMYHQYGMFGWTIPVNPVDNIDEQMYKGTLTDDALKLQDNYHLKTYLYPSLSFTDQENAVLKSKFTSIKDITSQYQLKYITGQDSLDNWNGFINQLKAAGLDEVTKIYNDAYVRYSK